MTYTTALWHANSDMSAACNTSNSFSLSNDYNDDIGWWAKGAARAYEITGTTRYKNCAKRLFDAIYAYWDTGSYGGGIWWTRSSPIQKNVATNAPAAITAAKLSAILNDSTYLDKAKAIYAWVKSTLTDGNGYVYDNYENGTLRTWQFSYNYGAFIGAAAAIYGRTNDSAYLNDAKNAANQSLTRIVSNGVLQDEGTSGDGGGFKGVYVRYVGELVSHYGQSQYTNFLQNNATVAWRNRRTSDNLVNANWATATGSGTIEAHAAGSAVAALQVVAADNNTFGASTQYEAETAYSNVNNESSFGGYTGSGYRCCWNGNGQFVTFYVAVGSAGNYKLAFHYGAGAGNASRKIVVNGANASANFTFSDTGGWSNWNTANLNVSLNAGSNVVTVTLDSSAGNSNYLNLDNMVVSSAFTTYEAESASSNVATESVYGGYTGSGYRCCWNGNGQYVTFTVNAASAGTYPLTFHYGAGAGNASRKIVVNGTTVSSNFSFSGTGGWSSWNSASLNANLNAGSNTVTVTLDSSAGNANYLNLDNLKV